MIVQHDVLKNVLGGSSKTELIVRLNEKGIRYIIGKGGWPFTTEKAINDAMEMSDAKSATPARNQVKVEI